MQGLVAGESKEKKGWKNGGWLGSNSEVAEIGEERSKKWAGDRSCMVLWLEVKDFVFILRVLGRHRKEGGSSSKSLPSHW